MISETFNNLTWYKKMEVLRVINGWGQRQAGLKCFTTNKNYWLWEKGKSYPNHSSRRSIANAFGVNMEYIFPPTGKIISNFNNKKITIIN
ncbi:MULTISPECIES: helix-turn-helix transcriptional regulator [Clostridium]|uniref:Helix-turn-helix domain-containing protein n=1 Tax=Clostridium frigoriphilum TaxID=443253 RepID=A0ABU7USA7_9CLOT|nr:helix-turn-helix domain-containing protein [Clostridium sp. DSM 17811]MBU3101540.1 helix-turn-helix domain-containing protein [Clostridium sp. DSM 17811]